MLTLQVSDFLSVTACVSACVCASIPRARNRMRNYKFEEKQEGKLFSVFLLLGYQVSTLFTFLVFLVKKSKKVIYCSKNEEKNNRASLMQQLRTIAAGLPCSGCTVPAMSTLNEHLCSDTHVHMAQVPSYGTGLLDECFVTWECALCPNVAAPSTHTCQMLHTTSSRVHMQHVQR